jgi:hypothetical protein
VAVAFDSVGPSAAGSGGASPRSYTHTTSAASTTVIVGASLDGVAVGATATCTVGGVTATSLGQVAAGGGTTGIVQAWYLAGVGSGAHTVVVTCSTAADVECGSMAYSGVGSLGTPFTNHSSGTGTTASVGVTGTSTGNMVAGFVAAGDTVNSTTQTSRWVNNFEGGAGQATGNAAGADAAGTGSTVTMSWTVNISPWAVIAVEVQAVQPPQSPPGPAPLAPGWFPGSAAVTQDPGGIPFYAEPTPTDATPATTVGIPFPEAAAPPLPPLPPGWFPGADRITAVPGGIPFEPLPPPVTAPPAVIFPVPEVAGIADWLPLPPNWFPGSSLVTTDPGAIPFYSLPQPLTPPPAPPPQPVITGQTGGNWAAYFHDQNGSPRLYLGGETWGLPGNAGRWNGGNWRGDYDNYHAIRYAQGYTANVTHPWGHTHTGCNNDLGHTWDGVFPFLVNGSTADLTGQGGSITLNDPFWQRIDYMLTSAAGVGITVFLDLSMANDMPTGAGHGFTNGVFQNASTAQIQSASQAVATRYASTPNLVWFFGDDYYNDDDTNYNAMWTGINAADPRIASCTSIEYYPTGNTARYDLSGAPGGETPHGWGNTHATYNFVYCYMQTYFGIEYAYTEPTQIGPVIWGDGMFWGNAGTSAQNDQVQRNNVWWSLASGARGFVAENENVLQWSSTAVASLTGDGAFPATVKNIYTLFSGLPGWWKLIPDTGNALVTAGRGTRAVYNSNEYLANTDNYVAASRVADGSLAVIYCAAAMSITIDQAKMAPGYTATWADPASGALTGTATGSTYSSSGLGSNSAGGADWVLILQGTPVAAPAAPALTAPLPPGWFPGADRVTTQPGGIPFYAQPQPTDQVAAAAAVTFTGTAAVAGAGTVAAVATQIAPASPAGVGAVAAVVTQIAPATVTAAGSVAAVATQIAPAAVAGAGAVTTAVTQATTATVTGAGSVVAVATQIAVATLAGAGAVNATGIAGGTGVATVAAAATVTAVITQIAPATVAAASSVSANGQITGTANLTAAAAVTAKATQIAVAAPAAAAALSAVATQIVPATVTGAGSVVAIGKSTASIVAATSSPTVTDPRDGTATVTDPRGGTATVTAAGTSSPTVS